MGTGCILIPTPGQAHSAAASHTFSLCLLSPKLSSPPLRYTALALPLPPL